MIKIIKQLSSLFIRFRYPFSTPEDIAQDIGLNMSNQLSFDEFIFCLTSPDHRPTKLIKYMPRAQAELVFKAALKKESFRHDSLYSYYFKGGWMEFLLHFDEQSRLRRLYMCHKTLKQKFEIPIE